MIATLVPGCSQALPPSEAKTESGVVRGSDDAGVISWKGIPFAAPPVGDLRWRAPQPAASWSGVRDATQYGHDCMQKPFASDAAPLGTPPAEDCLYLNVWKPAQAKGKLPVIFWIYGGGFVNGGSSPPTYSGAELAKKGVMFVSANYRLGRFGTFAHPKLTAANGDSGFFANYGYLDQIAALKWVRRNIAAFGGDPDNVTIIGESAGGYSVHFLLTSPLAKGLFAKAVVMSGGDAKAIEAGGLREAERDGLAFARTKGIAAGDPRSLAKLRALAPDDVVGGLNLANFEIKPGEVRTFSSPFVDGKIAVDAAKAYASGEFSHVPLMIGATGDDIGGKAGYMVAGARAVAGTIARQGVPVYEYRFSYVAQALNDKGAWHATDIPFFFDTQAIKYGEATTPRDEDMGDTISSYLVNFAMTGDPNGPGLPGWPRYSPKTDELMEFTPAGIAAATHDPRGAELDRENAKVDE
nr:carboxylesterase family protein [Tsuneonella mangrovi]